MTVYVIVQLKMTDRAADSLDYLEISRDRKAGAEGIALHAQGFTS